MGPYTGEIRLFAFNRVTPVGWLVCDGSLLPISQYTALYALIYNTYGGDGRETIALPNLKGKEPVPGSVYCICTNGIFPEQA
jgi:microcystin-dependent protein